MNLKSVFMTSTLSFFTALSARANAGHLYMQTNGQQNQIVHYLRQIDGSLIEAGRIATGGHGSGTYKPITGETNAPNAFESVGSVILTADHSYLFVTNGGDNTVSSFRVRHNGDLSLVDVQWTGQFISGFSGTAKSLAYSPLKHTLYVAHAFGPDHIHAFDVNAGHLRLQNKSYSVNTEIKTDRVVSQIALSPDESFLLADVLFDRRPQGPGPLKVSNSQTPDGLAVFPVQPNGELSAAHLTNAGGAGPFAIKFLNGNQNSFIQALAVGDGLLISRIDALGNVTNSAVTKLDTGLGAISEVCWLALSPDNSHIFATALAYGYVSSYRLDGNGLHIDQDPAAPAIAGDGSFHAINGDLTSSPVDSWMSPDGKYFYQIYPNASVLVAYEVNGGKLTEIKRTPIDYNTPIGLTGF